MPGTRAPCLAGKAPKGAQAGDAHVFVTGQRWLCQQQRRPCQSLAAQAHSLTGQTLESKEQWRPYIPHIPKDGEPPLSRWPCLPQAPDPMPLLSPVTRKPGPSQALQDRPHHSRAHLPAPRICLAPWLREQAQLHGWGSAVGYPCCQYRAVQQDKAGTQQELLLLEEIRIYKRVKNRCKIHSKKKGHDELGW